VLQKIASRGNALSIVFCNIAYIFKASIYAIFHHKLLLQNTIDRAEMKQVMTAQELLSQRKDAHSASFISGIRSCILQFAELAIFCNTTPNRLNRVFEAGQSNSKWVTDIKAVETAAGWLFLAVMLDLFSRMVVGWAMAASEDEGLVELALRMAVARRHPKAGLLHHSDRSSEFTSDRYQATLLELGIEVSMSRTANCWDNAAMEAFFATLTKECTDRTCFQSRQEARSAIFEYLECFNNPIRLHST
jgi:hypothetical protein